MKKTLIAVAAALALTASTSWAQQVLRLSHNAAPGNQNWEDVNGGNSDNDYNDVNIQATWTVKTPSPLGGTVHEDKLTDPHQGNPDGPGQTLMISTATGAASLLSLVAFGADGPGDFSLVEEGSAAELLNAQGLDAAVQVLGQDIVFQRAVQLMAEETASKGPALAASGLGAASPAMSCPLVPYTAI